MIGRVNVVKSSSDSCIESRNFWGSILFMYLMFLENLLRILFKGLELKKRIGVCRIVIIILL